MEDPIAAAEHPKPALPQGSRSLQQTGWITTLWLGALAAAVLANSLTSALPWRLMLPSLGFVSALRITQASMALITLFPAATRLGWRSRSRCSAPGRPAAKQPLGRSR